MKRLYFALFLWISLLQTEAKPVNFMVISADDMNWDSVSCFGGPMKDLTPHIDRLASKGIRFERAHVASTVCQPSRMAINSGLLPHRSGGEGFHYFRIPDLPTIPSTLSKNGYKVGILGKVKHSTPYEDTPWDFAEEIGRNTDEFKTKVSDFVDSAERESKPFYIIVNSHDPHRPYYKHTSEGKTIRGRNGKLPSSHPSRVYHPQDVAVPPFLPDSPSVREELADYYSSVRRCDDVVGRLLELLEEKKLVDDTIVFFLSDHGMGAPSAKGNAYLNSTKTPLIMRWPGKIKPGTVEADHFVSTLDIFPTLIEAANIPSPGDFDGTSLIPLFRGQSIPERQDIYFTQFYTNIGKNQFNMRTALSSKFSYTFNAFHTGERLYSGSSLGGNFFQSMIDAGKTNPKWKARSEHILRRAPEELYDLEKDPSCMNNIAANPEYAERIQKFRAAMKENMETTQDPVAPSYQVFIETGSVEKLSEAYKSTMEASKLVGHLPREVNMEQWLDPEAFAAKRKAARANKK